MSTRTLHDIPLNRVEGDLEIRVALEDGIVVDAWSSGTLYRGFENMLVGRKALDGLVITPRICGICTTTHLLAAAKALDAAAEITPPDNARRLRNVALMAEHIQSDVRHGMLMYAVDFTNPFYKNLPLYNEALRRYTPFQGEAIIETVRTTKQVLEIIAILGGQWPHSSFMVPGGVAFAPHPPDILQCRYLLDHYRAWYERRILGCSLARWAAVDSAAALEAWLAEIPAHADSELGFFLRFARMAGLDRIGRGHGHFLSYGSLDLPDDTAVCGENGVFIPAGFRSVTAGNTVLPSSTFDQTQIQEDISHSWYVDSVEARHPSVGQTRPGPINRNNSTEETGGRYSWAKAPRYNGQPAETGPLAERVVCGDPLFVDLIRAGGVNACVRQMARLVRPASLIPAMEIWLDEIARHAGEPFYRSCGSFGDAEGYGLIQAARGALGHWLRLRDGTIAHYQIITPTAWNGSPRDGAGQRGPWEEALIGTRVADPENPVELGHIIRSFDACLVCTVHSVSRNNGAAHRLRMRV